LDDLRIDLEANWLTFMLGSKLPYFWAALSWLRTVGLVSTGILIGVVCTKVWLPPSAQLSLDLSSTYRPVESESGTYSSIVALFPNGSDWLSPSAVSAIDAWSAVLSRCSGGRFRLVASTSSLEFVEGSAIDNVKLSQKRLTAVQSRFIHNGLGNIEILKPKDRDDLVEFRVVNDRQNDMVMEGLAFANRRVDLQFLDFGSCAVGSRLRFADLPR
jgi:hypothetical protein